MDRLNKNILFSADGAEFQLDQSLRELPDKRLVCSGLWKQRRVIAKLFLAPGKARRHWAREKQGIDALQKAGVPTPELIYSGAAADGTPVLVTNYLPDADTALDIWEGRDSPDLKADLLRQLAETVGRMHEAGLVQEDQHLENFLVSNNKIYAIDGDAIRIRNHGKPLGLKTSSRNLALLFAQFPPDHDDLFESAALGYAKQRNISYPRLLSCLKLDLPEVRRTRRRKYLAKCTRTCSEFVRSRKAGRTAVFRRDAQGTALTRLLDDPESFMQGGECLKNGATSTVARIQEDDVDWVVKRYNIKGLRHAFERCFRPTRAWTSWQNSHRLKISGIATPRAVAVIEKRFGPLRSTGYYVCDFVDGRHAKEVFQNDMLPKTARDRLAEQFVRLFGLFCKLKISHGDCKATNFICKDSELWVLDLDSMRESSSSLRFQKLFTKDRQRFLFNWQEWPELQRWFDEHLPECGRR